MPRARYRPRPWKLRWTERSGKERVQAFRWENAAADQKAYLERNGYRDVSLTYEEPPKERPL